MSIVKKSYGYRESITSFGNITNSSNIVFNENPIGFDGVLLNAKLVQYKDSRKIKIFILNENLEIVWVSDELSSNGVSFIAENIDIKVEKNFRVGAVINTSSSYLNGITATSEKVNIKNGISYSSIGVGAIASGYGGIANTVLPFELEIKLKTNKTLILHDGEYKKWIDKVDVKKSIPTMTSNTSPSGIASSSSNANTTFAYNAFDNNPSTQWLTSTNVTKGWIEYQFTDSKRIVKYSIAGSYNNKEISPKSWTFEGSNVGSNWTVLDARENEINWGLSERREYEFNNSSSYTKYRVNITLNNGYNYYVGLSELEMFEPINETLHSWQTVSSTLLTSEKFLSDGMDSLSPLLDRKVATLEPLPMTVKSGILQTGELGKTFSKTLSLKKYMDLRTINVEVE